MMREWSFGRKIAAGFAIGVLLTFVVALVGVRTLQRVMALDRDVINRESRVLIAANELELTTERRVASSRGFLLTREQTYLDQYEAANTQFLATMQRVRELMPEADREVAEIARDDVAYRAMITKQFELAGQSPDQVQGSFVSQMQPTRDQLTRSVAALSQRTEADLKGSMRAAADASTRGIWTLFGVGGIAVAFATFVAFLLTRMLTRQIGSAVSQIQSSSAELQAAATQQASGSREQATAMTEISTTISELLATSRQIAESAQRVAGMAELTADSARSGSATVTSTRDAVSGIQRQVQQVVEHMLALGKKSQRIGGVLDLVSELAEQTNILAINATIEATGAGEAGRRFGVVAEEIRKLADRVGGSAKEIRQLIEEVRSAVNTTIMATETGSKAVDAGAAQFGQVTSSFERIAGLVTTTTQASREIELSTKQQASAVEQVNVAIGNAAQATKETESSSAQTLQTAAELAALSRELLRVVRRESAA